MELRDIEALKLENQVQKSQLENYEDDFKHEREDRTRAVQERLKIEDEFDAYKNANAIQMAQLNKRVEELSLQLIEKDEVIQWFEGHNKISQYEEDFKHERADRIREAQARLKIVEEFETYKKAHRSIVPNKQLHARDFEHLLSTKQIELDSVKANLNAMENIMQKQLKDLNHQLNEAKEEIAVKVAQVKQYQKQVEDYKQQLEQCRSSMNSVPGQAPQVLHSANVDEPECSSASSCEPVNPEHSNPSLMGQAKSSCDGDYMLKPSSTPSQNAASNGVPDGGSEEDDSDDDLPPPMFFKPFQPMYHPAVAQKEDIPLSQLEASKRAHIKCNLPTSTPDVAQTVNTVDGIHGGISHIAAAIQRETDYRTFEETFSNVPLDPNLKCPKCGKVFKKGRIQKFKRHVQICQM